MKRRIFALLAASLVILPLGAYAADLAQPGVKMAQHHGHHGGRRGHGIKKLLSKLDLSSEQATQVKAIRDRRLQETEGLREQVKTQRQTMRELFASNASSSELQQQHQAMQNLRQQIGANRFEGILEIREILTPEQRTKMADLIKEHRDQKTFN